MDIRQLKYFLALLEQRNFAAAAEKLSVSQQAVSKTLSQLEAQLGVRLFERSAHGTTPTENALKLEPHARSIFAHMRLAMAELNPGASELGGFLSVGFGLNVPEGIVTDAINRFRQLRPSVGVQVHSQTSRNLQAMLVEGNVQVFLSAPPFDFKFSSEIEAEQVSMERVLLLVRREHILASMRPVPLMRLRENPWIIPGAQEAGWRKICDVFHQVGLAPPPNVVQTDSLSVARGLLLSDNYISLADRHLHQEALQTGAVVALEVEGLDLTRPVVIAVSRLRERTGNIATMVNSLRSAATAYDVES